MDGQQKKGDKKRKMLNMCLGACVCVTHYLFVGAFIEHNLGNHKGGKKAIDM